MSRIPLLILLASSLALAGCVDRQAQEQAKRTELIVGDTVRVVAVEPAQLQPLAEELELSGELVTGEDALVGSKVAGKIVAIHVKEGDTVSAGQVLASIDTSQLAAQVQQAQSQVAQATAMRAQAQAQLSQASKSAAVNPSRSSAQVRQAEAGVRAARAQLEKALAGARPEERRQAEAAVAAARTNMETQRRELERVQRLVEEGAIARNRLDMQQNAYQNALSQFETAQNTLQMIQSGARAEDIAGARAALSQAEETLRLAQSSQRLDSTFNDQVAAARAQVATADAQIGAARAQLSMAQQALADAQVRAPFGGQIAARPVAAGTVVAPGTPILRLVGGHGVYFEGNVPERLLGQIQVGTPVRVEIAATDRPFAGVVAAVSPAGDSVGRQFKVRIALTEGYGLLRPGMFARGRVQVREVAAATVLPASAIVAQGDESFVYIAEGDRARRVRVETGIRSGESVQVEGLPPGALVVVRGQDGLTDGAEIRVEQRAAQAEAAEAGKG
jgi:HlyD family secretion protein